MLTEKMTRWYFIISAAIIIFIIYVSLRFNNTESDDYQWKDIIELNDGWTYQEPDGKQIPIELPIDHKTSAGETYTLIHTLPQNLTEGSVLCFKNDHLLVDAYVESKKIYSLKVDERSTIGKSPGFSYVFIPLISDMAGKQIRIDYTAVYTGSSFHINKFYLGDKSTIVTELIRTNVIAIVICSMSICLGILFIITYFIKRKTFHMSKSLFYLGLFAIPFATWSLTETQTMQFFLSNTYALQYVTYLSLASCAYPFLMFFAERHKLMHSKSVMLIGCICFLSTVLCLVLQTFGFVDLPETLIFVHISIALVVGYTLYISIREILQQDKKKLKLSLSGISLMCMLICTVIDLVRYYSVVNGDYSRYCRVGFLIYLGCVGLSTILHSVKVDQENKELEQLAFADPVTGMQNQLAFERQLDAAKVQEPLVIIEIHIQQLDEITRDYGAKTRQEMLSSAGKMIERAFPESTQKYYLGENHFVIFLHENAEQIYNSSMSILRKRVHNSNKSRVHKMTISDSMTFLEEGSEEHIREAFEEIGISAQSLEDDESAKE